MAKKVSGPAKIQGTDGVRGLVLHSSEKRVKGLGPVEAYIQEGVITEEFCLLYGFCLGEFLKRKKLIRASDSVVVGWDPRDKDGFFNNSFIDGLSRSVKKITLAGMVPTPAVVVFMQYVKATAAAVLTASHNPPDQNGIKIFLAPLGMKLLPCDEEEFTELLYGLDLAKVKRNKKGAEVTDMHHEAVDCFRRFLLKEENSLLDSREDLSGYRLVIDSSNGAYSPISKRVFRDAGFKDVIETAGDLSKPVNEGCGVSMIEGKKEWDFTKEESAPPVISRIRKEMSTKDKKDGKLFTGIVFDGDGDRFLRLDGDLAGRKIRHLDGDKVAVLISDYLAETIDCAGDIPFINTIESDSGAGRSAEEKIFKNRVTGVGDRWILFYGILNIISGILRKKTIIGLNRKESDNLKKLYDDLRKGKSLSSVKISKTVESTGVFSGGVKTEAFTNLLMRNEISFGIAYEASGHLITAGFLTREDSAVVPVFTGNGMKAALNTIAADLWLIKNKGIDKRNVFFRKPFRESFKKTYYTYYSDRRRFAQDIALRRKIKRKLKGILAETFSEKYVIKEEKKNEEPELLFFNIYDAKKKCCATIYMRNSGTEEKTQITVKSDLNIAKKIEKAGNEIDSFLRAEIKSASNPLFLIQEKILRTLCLAETIHEDKLKEILSNDEKKYFSRVADETARKEKLISNDGKGMMSLTPTGEKYCFDAGLSSGAIPVILAAGKGTRMKSELPKVLHKVCGKTMLDYSISLSQSCGMFPAVVIVGYKSSLVIKETGNEGVLYALQKKQLGTGHAVLQTKKLLGKYSGDILILYGDIPLLSEKTIRAFLTSHRKSGCALSILTALVKNPFGYGRIVKDKQGKFLKIVEEKDASEDVKKIKEINSGIYCGKAGNLFDALGKIDNKNAQKEFYLTDVAGIMRKKGGKINIFRIKESSEVMGINSVSELEEAKFIMKGR